MAEIEPEIGKFRLATNERAAVGRGGAYIHGHFGRIQRPVLAGEGGGAAAQMFDPRRAGEFARRGDVKQPRGVQLPIHRTEMEMRFCIREGNIQRRCIRDLRDAELIAGNRVKRQRNAQTPQQQAAFHAAGQHHGIGGKTRFLGIDGHNAPVARIERKRLQAVHDAHLGRFREQMGRERLTQQGSVDHAVIRTVNAADEVLDHVGEQRHLFHTFGGRERLHVFAQLVSVLGSTARRLKTPGIAVEHDASAVFQMRLHAGQFVQLFGQLMAEGSQFLQGFQGVLPFALAAGAQKRAQPAPLAVPALWPPVNGRIVGVNPVGQGKQGKTAVGHRREGEKAQLPPAVATGQTGRLVTGLENCDAMPRSV